MVHLFRGESIVFSSKLDRSLYLHCAFRQDHGGYVIAQAEANRDDEQYSETNDRHDAKLLLHLIDTLLLGRDTEVPDPEDEEIAMVEGVHEFSDNDEIYLTWLAQHQTGFVMNTTRSKSSDYMVLHRANCPRISTYTKIAKPGAFTERDYIKVCALDVTSLKRWIKQHGRPDGSFSSECRCVRLLDAR